MKRREQILLTLFVLTLVGMGSAVGFDIYRKVKTGLVEEKWALELKLVEYETLLEEKSVWKSRGIWLKANQPPYTSRDAIDNHIFKTVKAPPTGVTVSNIKLIEGKETDFWIQAGVHVKASGTLKEVFGWLYELQSPQNFFVIENMKIIPDKKVLDMVRCDFELVRWYAPLKI